MKSKSYPKNLALVVDSLTDITSLSYTRSTFFEFKVFLHHTGNDTLRIDVAEFITPSQVNNNFVCVLALNGDQYLPLAESKVLIAPE
jgi:hypothetical protein